MRVFSCFDTTHDTDLHAILVRQAEHSDSPLSIVDWSRDSAPLPGWEGELRERLSAVDAVIVICGEFTDAAYGVSRELSLAQEQSKPYLLLRGRRTAACTRPTAAREADNLYTWIWEIVTSQLGDEVLKLSAAGRMAAVPE